MEMRKYLQTFTYLTRIEISSLFVSEIDERLEMGWCWWLVQIKFVIISLTRGKTHVK
jgi:hypothetical protein